MPTPEDEREKLMCEASSKIMLMFHETGLTVAEGTMALIHVIASTTATYEIIEGKDGQEMINHVCEALNDMFQLKRDQMNRPENKESVRSGILATKLAMKYFEKDKPC